MFGKMMNETLGKIHFWGTIIPFNCIFIPLFVLGAGGQHRRIYNYEHFPELSGPAFQDLRVFATTALLVMLVFQYRWLVSLEKASVIANQAVLENYLEAVTNEVRYAYAHNAERGLNLPPSLFRGEPDLGRVRVNVRRRPGHVLDSG